MSAEMSSLKCWIWPFQQVWRSCWPKSRSVRQSAAYTTLLFSAVFPAGLGSLFAGPPIDRWGRLVTSTQSSRLVHQSPPVLRISHGRLADRSWLEGSNRRDLVSSMCLFMACSAAALFSCFRTSIISTCCRGSTKRLSKASIRRMSSITHRFRNGSLFPLDHTSVATTPLPDSACPLS